MTAADQIATAVAALDEAHRALKVLSGSPAINGDLDHVITKTLEDIGGNVWALRTFSEECV